MITCRHGLHEVGDDGPKRLIPQDLTVEVHEAPPILLDLAADILGLHEPRYTPIALQIRRQAMQAIFPESEGFGPW